MKKHTRTVKIVCEFEVPFVEYETEKENQRAINSLQRWIKSMLTEDGAYIPLFVNKDDNGAYFDECSRKVKNVKVRMEEEQ